MLCLICSIQFNSELRGRTSEIQTETIFHMMWLDRECQTLSQPGAMRYTVYLMISDHPVLA